MTFSASYACHSETEIVDLPQVYLLFATDFPGKLCLVGVQIGEGRMEKREFHCLQHSMAIHVLDSELLGAEGSMPAGGNEGSGVWCIR